MHAASTCSASGARGAAAALPMSAASSKSGRDARFAILRLQLVEEANTGFCGACGGRYSFASPEARQLLHQQLHAGFPCKGSRSERASGLDLPPSKCRLSARGRDGACQKSAWAAPARVSSRVHA